MLHANTIGPLVLKKISKVLTIYIGMEAILVMWPGWFEHISFLQPWRL